MNIMANMNIRKARKNTAQQRGTRLFNTANNIKRRCRKVAAKRKMRIILNVRSILRSRRVRMKLTLRSSVMISDSSVDGITRHASRRFHRHSEPVQKVPSKATRRSKSSRANTALKEISMASMLGLSTMSAPSSSTSFSYERNTARWVRHAMKSAFKRMSVQDTNWKRLPSMKRSRRSQPRRRIVNESHTLFASRSIHSAPSEVTCWMPL
mmetsp:Transcript_24522/g.64465  ORF Transcript_24522/g.64465 Transcript_24522/m.64465 type:complete len:210 (+) Transcript_24522:215-844(+)